MSNPLKTLTAPVWWVTWKTRFNQQFLAIRQAPIFQGWFSRPCTHAPVRPNEVVNLIECPACSITIEYSYKINQAFDEPLRLVMRETEQSALDIMGRVRDLDHTASQLVNYLTKADQDTLDMHAQIQNSSVSIERIGQFMQQLPEKIEAERQGSAELVEKVNQIMELSAIAEAIKDISRLTNMVAINAAIQAAHAGEYGRGFTVVADEVRRLSTRSGEAADQISQTVKNIHQAIHTYLDSRLQRDFAHDLREAAHVAESVHQLQDSHEDMNQYYKTLLTVVKEYNNNMANAIVEALGNMQYQDVVRQRLERVLVAQTRYRDVLKMALDEPALLLSPRFKEDLEQVLSAYIEEESHHGDQSSAQGDGEDAAPMIELF